MRLKYKSTGAPVQKRAAVSWRRSLSFKVFYLGLAASTGLSGSQAFAQAQEGAVAGPQAAQNGTPGAPTQPQPAAPSFFSAITTSVQVESGILANGANPSNGQNFGQLFSDHANEPLLNQVLVTISKPIDSAAKGYDFGFTLQGIYGTDARFIHILGIDDNLLTGRNQIVPNQAFLAAHLPWLTALGIDAKIGIVPGLQGYEALDPSQRPFYTFSYISNYLLPFLHVGAQATYHINPTLDIITGIDAGNQTGLGSNDNNSEPAGYLGLALNNLLDGKLTVTAVTRLGPEDPVRIFPNGDSLERSWTDVVATYKYSDKLTFTGEGNFLYDRGFGPGYTAYGLAGYAAYVYNDMLTFNGRAEVMRDNTGFIVGNYIGATSFTNSLRGLPYGFEGQPAPTTFASFTVNTVIKPVVDWKALHIPVKTLIFRPEIRYDVSLNGTAPFNTGTSKDAFMFGGDIVVGF